ncbi:hypothetical protein LEP1GSC082_1304 [Leptospira kirschneri str. H2]|uniref:Uncharacterized protein n=2 Tax=Leptospira kirschneri TaxID=29507 RepID=A0A0E2B4I9_9LEPT|nr:hypothetical protein LEP1GSC081_3911 [Leptospira kirschneri str. H1]EKO62154.1 hypothetical protein LEP1GSC082_1304 [Leptospira kirschneri str. H2]EMK24032.1 hypothetical protein LEP1GSC008_1159 [Leptospira kirschneri serovar Bulgarica str. Nikolaevo]
MDSNLVFLFKNFYKIQKNDLTTRTHENDTMSLFYDLHKNKYHKF